MLAEVKEYLNYSVDEDVTALTQHITDGKARLQSLTGTVLDFEVNIFAKELLKNYVRYAVNHGAEYFEENFASEILRLQLLEGVGRLESKD